MFKAGVKNVVITPDKGSGEWGVEKVTLKAIEFRTQLKAVAAAYKMVGKDASQNLNHYLDNTGDDLFIDLDRMVDEVPSAMRLWETVVGEAKQFAQSLPEGEHTFVSDKPWNGYNTQKENSNWYYASGGYSVWVKCFARITNVVPALKMRRYELDIEYVYYDRYNWDVGKQITFHGVNIYDADMGMLHRQGLAREFDMRGVMNSSFAW